MTTHEAVVKQFIEEHRKPSKQVYKILSALLNSSEPTHGYALMKKTSIKRSTVYGCASKLEKDGFIIRISSTNNSSHPKDPFELTSIGREYARQVIELWDMEEWEAREKLMEQKRKLLAKEVHLQ